MNAAIYVRVSTDRQAEKGYSISTQLAACRRYAAELGAEEIKEFIDDGYSAEFLDRPALSRMREAVRQKKFAVVIFYDPDRMARNLLHQLLIAEEIDKSGADLKFVLTQYDQSPDGRFMFGIRGLLAELEKEKIKERTLRGKKGKAAKGLVIRDAKPYGYTFDAQRSTYRINEAEAKTVRLLFHYLIDEQLGTVRIARELQAQGILSPRGKLSWSPSTVHHILTNSLYKGIIYSMKYRYKKVDLHHKKRTLRPQSEWLPVKVPAIVDETLWLAAQHQLKENRSLAKRNGTHTHLLAGLVFCAQCKKRLLVSYSGSSESICYYTCKKTLAGIHAEECKCRARPIPARLLDQLIFQYLFSQYYSLNSPAEWEKLILSYEAPDQSAAPMLRLRALEQDLIQQKAALLRWFQQKKLLEQEVEENLQNLSVELTKVHRQLERLKAEQGEQQRAEQNSSLLFLLKKLPHSGCTKLFTLGERQAALRAVIDKIFVERLDHSRGRGSFPRLAIRIQCKQDLPGYEQKLPRYY